MVGFPFQRLTTIGIALTPRTLIHLIAYNVGGIFHIQFLHLVSRTGQLSSRPTNDLSAEAGAGSRPAHISAYPIRVFVCFRSFQLTVPMFAVNVLGVL